MKVTYAATKTVAAGNDSNGSGFIRFFLPCGGRPHGDAVFFQCGTSRLE